MQRYIVKPASRPHRAGEGVRVLIKTLPGQTRDGQYTQQIRQLAARSDLQPLASGSERTRGEREHEFIYRLMSGSQMNKPRTICDLRGLLRERRSVRKVDGSDICERPEVIRRGW